MISNIFRERPINIEICELFICRLVTKDFFCARWFSKKHARSQYFSYLFLQVRSKHQHSQRAFNVSLEHWNILLRKSQSMLCSPADFQNCKCSDVRWCESSINQTRGRRKRFIHTQLPFRYCSPFLEKKSNILFPVPVFSVQSLVQ